MLIFFVALMLFGSKSLPGFAKTLGKAYREFKRASDDIKQELAQNAEIGELKREIDSLRNDLSGNFSGIHDSISSEVNRTKSTVLNEVETVKQPMVEPSATHLDSNIETVTVADSDYQHDVYREAAEKANITEDFDSTLIVKEKAASVNTNDAGLLLQKE